VSVFSSTGELSLVAASDAMPAFLQAAAETININRNSSNRLFTTVHRLNNTLFIGKVFDFLISD